MCLGGIAFQAAVRVGVCLAIGRVIVILLILRKPQRHRRVVWLDHSLAIVRVLLG